MKWLLAQSGCSFAAGWRQLYCFSLQLSPSEPACKEENLHSCSEHKLDLPSTIAFVTLASHTLHREGKGLVICNFVTTVCDQ